ncbi:NAD-dependent epimerase/dehydratase family protein [Hyphococcus luteus]|uniref:NAD-dependent epimerase/dehydratase family protein n=1 Tax=Hyphococcus luteus TaxID=2058213 RepID=UPI0013FE40D6|nr:NAD(P)-dependent oxidoreductase [Marinicaulis flavus]
MKAAVTGGTGFVGAALIDLLLEQGWDVAALARDPARLPAAKDVRIVKGALEDETALAELAAGADVFFHLAGLTHARAREDYARVNVEGAAKAARAAKDANARLVHASSMSARQPQVSPYAKSKFDSETAVARAGGDWRALRLPAIYGPRDMVTLPFFKLVKAGFALAPKTDPAARASILYVEDAAGAMLAAAEGAAPGAVYEVGDEREEGHSWREIGEILGEVLGKHPRAIAVPRPAIAAYHGATRAVESALGKGPSVREGQVNEFFHPDWTARENLLSEASGWRPKTPLKEGFAKTARWYQEHGLL